MKSIRSSLGKDRGVSPVIGVIIMVSSVIIIAATIGLTVTDTADSLSDPTPQVKFDIKETDSGVKITHESGDSIDGDKIKLAGAATKETVPEWEGETVSAGDSATIKTIEGELNILYKGEDGSDSSRLALREVSNTLTPTFEIDKITSGYFSENHIKLYMGDISDTPDNSVYVVVKDGGEKSYKSGDTKSILKDPSQGGMYQTHTLKIYETSSRDSKLDECTINRAAQHYDEWNSPCS